MRGYFCLMRLHPLFWTTDFDTCSYGYSKTACFWGSFFQVISDYVPAAVNSYLISILYRPADRAIANTHFSTSPIIMGEQCGGLSMSLKIIEALPRLFLSPSLLLPISFLPGRVFFEDFWRVVSARVMVYDEYVVSCYSINASSVSIVLFTREIIPFLYSSK